MAGGVVVSAGGRADYPGKLTGYVIITCIIAATGGLIFGYDIGISGGVTNMSPFLKKFFRNVYRRKEHDTTTNQYCTFDSVVLTLFTSSLYLAALVASLFASWATWKFGRKISMLFGGAVFLAGAAINGAAMNVEMLIIGRILLGIGVGFANQSVPVYLSEMAPARYRGALNMCFQLMITIGILAANVINYGTNKIKGGWRYSLGGAGIPALIISLGSLFLPDTPNYIIDRFPAEKEKARSLLRKIRGTDDIEEEYKDLVAASVASQSVGNPWQNILKRKYRPQLVMSIAIPFFQQFTGINVIMFYAPVLFTSIGFGDNASLISAVITGSVNVFATLVSIYFVDKLGRRFLFLQGGFQMFLFQIAVGTLIAIKFGTSGVADISKGYANGVVACICIYVAGFAWSWGPLGWLVPSEIFPLEIRSAGQSINVCVNMFFTFLIAQVFLAMLCHMKFGLFYFFAGWVFIMTIFIKLFLPETKNVPIEEMFTVWESHWFWKKYAADNEDTAAGDQELKKIPV